MDRADHVTLGRIWLCFWPYQERLPHHPEPVSYEAERELPGRVPGWVDESN